jgi:hypothetical protein
MEDDDVDVNVVRCEVVLVLSCYRWSVCCATALGFRRGREGSYDSSSDSRGFGKGGCLELNLRELALKIVGDGELIEDSYKRGKAYVA